MNTNYSLAIFLKLLHGFIFAVLSIVMVIFSSNLPLAQLIFLRAIIATLISFILMVLLKAKHKIFITKKSVKLYIIRAIIHFAALFCWVYALKELGVNEAVALGYVAPLWKIILANIFLQEKWSKKTIFIIIFNSLGVLIILKPKLSNLSILGLLAGLISTIFWAIYDIICKKQTNTEHYIAQSFYSHFFISLISFPIALYLWKSISIQSFLGVGIIALFGVINIIVLFLGYQKAPVIFLIPYEYGRLIFATILSYLLNNTVPTFNLFFGAAIILGSGVYYCKNELQKENIKIAN